MCGLPGTPADRQYRGKDGPAHAAVATGLLPPKGDGDGSGEAPLQLVPEWIIVGGAVQGVEHHPRSLLRAVAAAQLASSDWGE